MALNLLAAGFAVLMLLRHAGRARPLLARGADPLDRRRALPSFLTAAVALLLLAASLWRLAALRS